MNERVTGGKASWCLLVRDNKLCHSTQMISPSWLDVLQLLAPKPTHFVLSLGSYGGLRAIEWRALPIFLINAHAVTWQWAARGWGVSKILGTPSGLNLRWNTLISSEWKIGQEYIYLLVRGWTLSWKPNDVHGSLWYKTLYIQELHREKTNVHILMIG